MLMASALMAFPLPAAHGLLRALIDDISRNL